MNISYNWLKKYIDLSLTADELPAKLTMAGLEVEGIEKTGSIPEGVVTAKILLKGADGGHRTAELSLPVLFPLDTDGEYAEAECLVCGLNLRRKKSGEVEAEATLRIALRSFDCREWRYIDEGHEGEVYGDADCGFSVFMTDAGEELWQVSKRKACPPDDLKKCNPDLEFPLKDRQKIFVYRQIK